MGYLFVCFVALRPKSTANSINYFLINLHQSMGPGRDRTRYPWICSQTCICCQTRYRLRYVDRHKWVMKMKLTCTNYFILLKKVYKRAHQKSKCLCSGLPRPHILGCGISFPPPPPESQLAFLYL